MVVEDMSCFDTNAIILKGTTVLTYKPKLLDRPFSGSLFGIEVRRNKFVFVKYLKFEDVMKILYYKYIYNWNSPQIISEVC